MTEMPELARRFQAKIDRAFPRGVLLAAEDPGAHTYPVPRPEVIALRGLDPVVFLDVPSWGRNFTGPLTGWETVRTSPCLVVKVTLSGKPMLWSGNISAAQARSLHGARARSLQLSAEGKLYRGLE